MDECMSIVMQMIYIEHHKNQQYDQYAYLSLCEKIQYKQKCVQHIHINGNHCILSLIDSHEYHYRCIIFDSNKSSNKFLNHETFKKFQCFISSFPLNYIYIVVMWQHDTCLCGFFIIVYAINITFNI